ncbi:unnamed protein product [Gongylonema pulchrum]|uniref:PAZ domain-containing protein n=1 Tax=Gongylonema pulchrum TaxID=637853 RepID=A0A183D9D7_9BILA|nr:unnamed protein product [Gongylonema pulchrum]
MLVKIEKEIARYNSLSDNKIASIHMSNSGNLKMFGSKRIINACLHSSMPTTLEEKYEEKRKRKEKSVEDMEIVSIPLVHTAHYKVDFAKDFEIRSILIKFINSMHFPWSPWFDIPQNPEYWPEQVPFYNPSSRVVDLEEIARLESSTAYRIDELERNILQFAFYRYNEFIRRHFGNIRLFHSGELGEPRPSSRNAVSSLIYSDSAGVFLLLDDRNLVKCFWFSQDFTKWIIYKATVLDLVSMSRKTNTAAAH